MIGSQPSSLPTKAAERQAMLGLRLLKEEGTWLVDAQFATRFEAPINASLAMDEVEAAIRLRDYERAQAKLPQACTHPSVAKRCGIAQHHLEQAAERSDARAAAREALKVHSSRLKGQVSGRVQTHFLVVEIENTSATSFEQIFVGVLKDEALIHSCRLRAQARGKAPSFALGPGQRAEGYCRVPESIQQPFNGVIQDGVGRQPVGRISRNEGS